MANTSTSSASTAANQKPTEVGFVRSVKDFLVYLDGLPTLQINDLVQNEAGLRGWVTALQKDKVEVLMVDDGEVTPGQMFQRGQTNLSVPVGPFLLGRAVDPLAVPIDGKGKLAVTDTTTLAELDPTAKGISFREFINHQFDTGITLVDSLIPVGKGQRELVLGDARSGKTSFLIDIIVNQKYTKTVCIYALIGKPITEVRNMIDILHSNNALDHTIVVAASSTDPAPLIFLTPQTAFSIAEYFQKQGQDVLIILDDMGNHAKIYREISLLANVAPGRESYPGDIFYQHAHLLERAGSFNRQAGGGSITALPVIELNLNDFTTLIPTNVMAMTDGHLLFKSALYSQGQRPAIDLSLSVSRVGQQTQTHTQNLLATKVKQVLAEATQLETVSRFSFELPFETQLLLRQKILIEEMIKQEPLIYISKEIQSILLALPFTGMFQDKDAEFVRQNLRKIIESFASDPQLLNTTRAVPEMKDDNQLIALLEKATSRLEYLLGLTKKGAQKA
ncbi:F0F1 ATP synthase subunit alpha [Patescibacteria group bacterium]|nr:F0F1 ATP synthase subunit alpha [Patescibacteria group bacterium]MCL5409309.1 F0F1 ATP synthase subunit alpha [Patescibacteria group bacterium]